MNDTTRLRPILVGFVASAFVLVVHADPVAADDCRRGCNLEKRDCLQVERTTQLGCRLECREMSAPQDLGECMRGCSDTYRTAKQTCKDSRSDCRQVCEVPPDDPSVDGQCVSDCARDLGACARDSAGAARACRTEQCAGLRGMERATCVRECASAVAESSDSCLSTFMSCMSGCGAVPTTTTPQAPTTTLQAPPTTTPQAPPTTTPQAPTTTTQSPPTTVPEL